MGNAATGTGADNIGVGIKLWPSASTAVLAAASNVSWDRWLYCSGKLISPVLAGSFQVLSTYVMKLFFGLYDGFPWKSIRRDADSGNIW